MSSGVPLINRIDRQLYWEAQSKATLWPRISHILHIFLKGNKPIFIFFNLKERQNTSIKADSADMMKNKV